MFDQAKIKISTMFVNDQNNHLEAELFPSPVAAIDPLITRKQAQLQGTASQYVEKQKIESSAHSLGESIIDSLKKDHLIKPKANRRIQRVKGEVLTSEQG